MLLSESTGVFPRQLFIYPWKTIVITEYLGKEGSKLAVSKWLSSTGDPRPHSATWVWGEVRSLLWCQCSPKHHPGPSSAPGSWAWSGALPGALNMEELQQCGDLAVTWEWSQETGSFSYGNTSSQLSLWEHELSKDVLWVVSAAEPLARGFQGIFEWEV